MNHKLLLIYSWLVRTLLFFLPDIPFIMRFRGWLYGLGMAKCGKDFQVTHSVILNSLECINIGNHVYLANFCNLIGNGKITIGDEVLLGPGVIVAAGNHQFSGNSYRFANSKPLNVTIGKGSWISANCTIVGESFFPPQSILAANSVYLKCSENNTPALYAGNPAIQIKLLK